VTRVTATLAGRRENWWLHFALSLYVIQFQGPFAHMAYDFRLIFQAIEACLRANARVHLSDLARQLGVERHTVERAVRMATGMTFRQLRVEVAKAKVLALLGSGTVVSIKGMAFEMGFTSESAFCRFCKRAFGLRPTQFRLAKHCELT
jgi:AraC-like DNA-binding protein